MKLIECFDPVTFEFLNEKGYLKINDETNECYLSLNLFYAGNDEMHTRELHEILSNQQSQVSDLLRRRCRCRCVL